MLKLGTPLTVRKNLADVLDSVRRLEGECKENERAWVACRQLTEGEEGAVERIKGSFQPRFDGDTQIMPRPIGWGAVRREIVSHALCGAGNLVDEKGKPLFRFTSAGVQRFDETWDSLHPDVAEAIVRVALFVNPNLDVGNVIHEDPLIWLRKTHPEIYAEMQAYLEDAKNAGAGGTQTT